MKYFAKYLPVEGEIKEGDLIRNNLDGLVGNTIRSLNAGELKDKEYSKVKLFLCSREVSFDNYELPKLFDVHKLQKEYNKYSDDLTFEQWFNTNIKWIQSIGAFKVIGEISKEAIWVIEDMEFYDEDIQLRGCLQDLVLIKCPTCKTYH